MITAGLSPSGEGKCFALSIGIDCLGKEDQNSVIISRLQCIQQASSFNSPGYCELSIQLFIHSTLVGTMVSYSVRIILISALILVGFNLNKNRNK